MHFVYERLTLYETPLRFYLIGSNATSSIFNVLKIERSDPKKLLIAEDNYQYSRNEIDDLLIMVSNLANIKKPNSANNDGRSVNSVLNAIDFYGLLGFVQFLEGYYMILVTKACRICKIGYHWMYKVEETSMIYIPEESPKFNIEEQRYLRTFQAVDLSTNFYFSYSYDLTRPLAHNVNLLGENNQDCGLKLKYLWNGYLAESCFLKDMFSKAWILPVIHGFLGQSIFNLNNYTLSLVIVARRSCKFAGTRFLKRGANFEGYVANDVETEQILYDPSLLAIERGRFTSFVQYRGSVPLIWSQNLAKVVGKPPIEIDLVDPFCSIQGVHFRDLIQSYQPPVVVVNLVKRRGDRLRTRENVLNDELKGSVDYLNQFLDPDQSILYCSFDMAKCLKAGGNVLGNLEEIGYNVVKTTGWFQTFEPPYCHSLRPSQYLDGCKCHVRQCVLDAQTRTFCIQKGVARMNCVDCLDRTNVAQLVMGKVALAFQLHALGALSEPYLPWESEICRTFETLFEEQGDTLALQYAGSQLVHSVRTYKKTSVLQERSRDVIQTLSRYYSNTFADYDKQNALNLFLGLYRPQKNKIPLWDVYNDFWIHNENFHFSNYCCWFMTNDELFLQSRYLSYKETIEKDNFKLSEFDSYYKTYKFTPFDQMLERVPIRRPVDALNQMTNTNLNSKNGKSSASSIGGIFKKKTTKPGKNEEKEGDSSDSDDEDASDRFDYDIIYSDDWKDATLANSDSTLYLGNIDNTKQAKKQNNSHRKKSTLGFLPHNTKISRSNRGGSPCANFFEQMATCQQVYGFELRDPTIDHRSQRDAVKYAKFASLGLHNIKLDDDDDDEKLTESILPKSRQIRRLKLSDSQFEPMPMSLFTTDNCYSAAAPEVASSAMAKYKATVACSRFGAKVPESKDAREYEDYVSLLARAVVL